MEHIRSLRTGMMAEYPVKSTSQGTYGRIEQRSEVKRETYKMCRAGGGARTGVENRCCRLQKQPNILLDDANWYKTLHCLIIFDYQNSEDRGGKEVCSESSLASLLCNHQSIPDILIEIQETLYRIQMKGI